MDVKTAPLTAIAPFGAFSIYEQASMVILRDLNSTMYRQCKKRRTGPTNNNVATKATTKVMKKATTNATQTRRKNGSDYRRRVHYNRRRGLPEDIIKTLQRWCEARACTAKGPYPTEYQKRELVTQVGLNLVQINNWFSNWRRRHWTKKQRLRFQEERRLLLIAEALIAKSSTGSQLLKCPLALNC